ncbi:MAG: hypothetical protein IT320_25275 [Anaerolineae bacterium]|nr:hypothetical protein [Anaerolineae bacterium]
MHPKDPIRGRLIEGYVDGLWRETDSLRPRRLRRRHPARAAVHLHMRAHWPLAALSLLLILSPRGGG